MSLNFKEIDLVLSELSLPGMRIQKVFQPSYDTIILELFGQTGKLDLLVSVSPGACRIHPLANLPAKNERPLRFMECLRSRVRGGRIESAEQLSSDRIVKIGLSVPQETEAAPDEADKRPKQAATESLGTGPTGPSIKNYRLYIRLWSGAGNIVLVDEDNIVVDALFRKPEKGESSGLPCRIETSALPQSEEERLRKTVKFTVRDLPGSGSFSQKIEAQYGATVGDLSRDSLLKKASERFGKRLRFLENREEEMARLLVEYGNAERCRQIGDLLMAGGFEYKKSPSAGKGTTTFIVTHDFYEDKPVSIQIDSSLSGVENAQRYYEKSRKAASGLEDIETELTKVRQAKDQLRTWLEGLKAEKDPFAIARALEKAGTVRETALKKYPCIWIENKGWTMLVGRSAKENDELLRRHIRGSDLWLHARDYSGSYVFIKAQRGKTFPLDIMLDAGHLAIYYSKARKNMDGNVYYTQAKYLRRVKDGPKGLVLPALEKNLFIRLDAARIKELLAHSSGGEP